MYCLLFFLKMIYFIAFYETIITNLNLITKFNQSSFTTIFSLVIIVNSVSRFQKLKISKLFKYTNIYTEYYWPVVFGSVKCVQKVFGYCTQTSLLLISAVIRWSVHGIYLITAPPCCTPGSWLCKDFRT